PEYVEPVKIKKEEKINFIDSLVVEKVNNFNENNLDDVLLDENLNDSDYEIFEEKINEEFSLDNVDTLINNESLVNDNEKVNNGLYNLEISVPKDYEVNLNLIDLSDKEIAEFEQEEKQEINFLDEQNSDNASLNNAVTEIKENEIEISIPENFEDTTVNFENDKTTIISETNEKDSQNLQNNNYNFTLDKLKKERQEKISKELIDNSEKFIDKVKENVANELDDVIKGLEDLNINDDSIYDIENIKIKFKNI
ncbi:MAG: ABC transporter permease, partial [Malacoplasma sp.]|nr:ABC transporter permease [Malacoplasma sp.]